MKTAIGCVVLLLILSFLVGWIWVVADVAHRLLQDANFPQILVIVPLAIFTAIYPWYKAGQLVDKWEKEES